MEKFTEEDVAPGWQSEQKEGVYAEFTDDGALKHYGLYTPWLRYVSEMDQERLAGSFDQFERREFECEAEPGSEQFNQDLLAFAKNWIEKIEKHRIDCSFCGLSSFQVKQIVSGPRDHICNECIELSQQIISEE